MSVADRIFIVGPMGSGKTTVGQQVAAGTAKTFIDSDQEIQRRTGVDIPTIFEFEGEEGFRRREKVVIDELTAIPDQVLATGGGAVLLEENRQHLASRGLVVYLFCSAEQQFSRTRRDTSRPLLQTEDPLRRLRELMQERDPLYRSVADWVVMTEGRSAKSVAREIIKRYRDAQ